VEPRQPGVEHGHHGHPDGSGFVYLVAVMDWFSRFVLSWSLSLTLQVEFCVEALKRALRRGRRTFSTATRVRRFTSEKFTGELAGAKSRSAWTGGPLHDTSSSSGCWRSLKYERCT